jgi:RNA polymerase sigma factor for flagellar operon FliA
MSTAATAAAPQRGEAQELPPPEGVPESVIESVTEGSVIEESVIEESEDKLLRRDALILKHLPLVRAIANRVRENLPVQVELDDLVHAGILGLFDAVEKFDPRKKVVFHLYAKHRIRGAILDSLRQLDWASRDLRKRHKSIETTTQRLAQMLGRLPSETEVAESMGVSQERFRKQTQELFTAGLTSGQPHRVEKPDHTSFAETSQSSEQRPDELFSNHQLRGVLNRAIETLPPRYRKVIKLYYNQDRTMKQIGSELGVNESRVSQIHKTALEKLGIVLRADGYHSPEVFLGAEKRV